VTCYEDVWGGENIAPGILNFPSKNLRIWPFWTYVSHFYSAG
jgi:hypothetical protein